jgi:hypothetical protein
LQRLTFWLITCCTLRLQDYHWTNFWNLEYFNFYWKCRCANKREILSYNESNLNLPLWVKSQAPAFFLDRSLKKTQDKIYTKNAQKYSDKSINDRIFNLHQQNKRTNWTSIQTLWWVTSTIWGQCSFKRGLVTIWMFTRGVASLISPTNLLVKAAVMASKASDLRICSHELHGVAILAVRLLWAPFKGVASITSGPPGSRWWKWWGFWHPVP